MMNGKEDRFFTFLMEKGDSNGIQVGPYALRYAGLEHHFVQGPQWAILFIGHAVDLEAGPVDRALLDEAARACQTAKEWAIHSSQWTGAFVCFLWDNLSEILFAFGDTCGQVAAFYDEGNQQVAGQIRELVEHRGGTWMDDDRAKAVSLSGVTMPFAGIRRLMPNHLLTCGPSTWTQTRFFPFEELVSKPSGQVAEAVAKDLRKYFSWLPKERIFRSGLTAGLDSRSLVFAIHEMPQCYFFTRVEGQNPVDVRIAKALAQLLGLNHRCEEESIIETIPLDEQRRWFDASDVPIKLPKGFEPDRTIIITGHAAEVAKAFYARNKTRNPRKLLIELGAENRAALLEDMSWWLEGIQSLPPGWHPGDLLYWEWRMPQWFQPYELRVQARGITRLVPYANRKILATLLACPPRDRQSNWHVPLQLLGNEMKATGHIPFNPGVKSRVLRLLQRIGVYTTYRSIRFHARPWVSRKFKPVR